MGSGAGVESDILKNAFERYIQLIFDTRVPFYPSGRMSSDSWTEGTGGGRMSSDLQTGGGRMSSVAQTGGSLANNIAQTGGGMIGGNKETGRGLHVHVDEISNNIPEETVGRQVELTTTERK